MEQQTLPEGAHDKSTRSVLRLLNDCSGELERLLGELRHASDAEPALRAIAAQVVQAVAQNADIALASILLNRISGTYPVRHCIETALVAALVARAMQQSSEETLVMAGAALTMNVAMLAQHDSFQHQSAPLDRAELEIIRRHPDDGAAMLACAGVRDPTWISIVQQHHERGDGSGYPDGKSGPDITPAASLIGLADRYCALVSARNYRRSMLPDLALRTLLAPENGAGTGIDAELARQFQTELGPFPPGTLVRLCNGEMGVVTRRKGPRHGICVQVLLGADDKPVVAGTAMRDTEQINILEALHEDQAQVRFSMQQIWGNQASL